MSMRWDIWVKMADTRICPLCRGKGTHEHFVEDFIAVNKHCERCEGKGYLWARETKCPVCPRCGGTGLSGSVGGYFGTVRYKPCERCGGKGYLEGEKVGETISYSGSDYGRCVTHHICDCKQEELDRLRDEVKRLSRVPCGKCHGEGEITLDEQAIRVFCPRCEGKGYLTPVEPWRYREREEEG